MFDDFEKESTILFRIFVQAIFLKFLICKFDKQL